MDERTETETKIRKMNTFAIGSLPVHFSVAKLFNFRWQYTIDICKQKIVLTFYKTEYCSSDLERRFSSHTDAERHEKADSLSYVAKDTLVLYKNKDAIDTLYLNSPKGPSRGMYIYTNGSIVSLNNSYSNSINKVIKVDKNTYRIIRTISDDYNPNADHSSHMSHYSSRQ